MNKAIIKLLLRLVSWLGRNANGQGLWNFTIKEKNMDYTILKNEIQTDPKALGYAPNVTSGNDAAIANLLNTVGLSNETVPKEVVNSFEIMSAIVYSEWVVLTSDQKNYLLTIISAGQVDPANGNIKTAFGTIFGASTVTRTNLNAIATRPASRAEVLFGRGVAVSAVDIAKALRG